MYFCFCVLPSPRQLPSIYLMQKLLYTFCLLAGPAFVSAQVVTGSWYGKADVQMEGLHNNYLTELVIKQKGTHVEGIFGYYFRDKYQSFFVKGTYNPKTREVIIPNIPLIYVNSNSTVNSIECNTNFRGTLIHSRAGSSVSGTFYRDEKYKYTCPDIKVSYVLDKSDNQQDSIYTATNIHSRIWKPQDDDFVVDAAAPVVASGPSVPANMAGPSPVPAAVTTQAPAKEVADAKPAVVKATTAASQSGPASSLQIAHIQEDNERIAAAFASRKTVVSNVYEIEGDSVRLSFYDNGEIDGDSISVFVNNQVEVTHQELAAKAFNLYLHLDSTKEVNDISMFAENLGRIPPNTALMVITDGKNRYEVFLSSSLTENAGIKLKRKK